MEVWVGGEPEKTAGPTLRGAAMRCTLQEGPKVRCGLAVSPGKPPLPTVPWGVCQTEFDVTCCADSISTVLKQSLEYQWTHLNKALEKAKADVTELTTLSAVGKPIFEGFRK